MQFQTQRLSGWERQFTPSHALPNRFFWEDYRLLICTKYLICWRSRRNSNTRPSV